MKIGEECRILRIDLVCVHRHHGDVRVFAFDGPRHRSSYGQGLNLGQLEQTPRIAREERRADVGTELQIVEADEQLKHSERENPMFGKDIYYISILGTPSEKEPWMLQFGGHHLAVNVTIAGEQGVLTPTLTGAQPSLYTVNGKTVRPLGGESDKALALLKRHFFEYERYQAVRSKEMMEARVDAVFASIKDDPQFIAMTSGSDGMLDPSRPMKAQMGPGN